MHLIQSRVPFFQPAMLDDPGLAIRGQKLHLPKSPTEHSNFLSQRYSTSIDSAAISISPVLGSRVRVTYVQLIPQNTKKKRGFSRDAIFVQSKIRSCEFFLKMYPLMKDKNILLTPFGNASSAIIDLCKSPTKNEGIGHDWPLGNWPSIPTQRDGSSADPVQLCEKVGVPESSIILSFPMLETSRDFPCYSLPLWGSGGRFFRRSLGFHCNFAKCLVSSAISWEWKKHPILMINCHLWHDIMNLPETTSLAHFQNNHMQKTSKTNASFPTIQFPRSEPPSFGLILGSIVTYSNIQKFTY